MTLTEAKEKLELWQNALDTVAVEGQSYQMGRLILTHVDVDKCLKMVQYYEGMVNRLNSGRRPGARVLRVVPRDF